MEEIVVFLVTNKIDLRLEMVQMTVLPFSAMSMGYYVVLECLLWGIEIFKYFVHKKKNGTLTFENCCEILRNNSIIRPSRSE